MPVTTMRGRLLIRPRICRRNCINDNSESPTANFQIIKLPTDDSQIHDVVCFRTVIPHRPLRRTPTAGLLLGMLVTLAAVVAASWYISRQISGLRALQTDLGDRNRKDSLQLLRIQNDLNSIALAMRDMLDNDSGYPLTAWAAQFDRIRGDLEDALRMEEQVAVARRTPEQSRYLVA